MLVVVILSVLLVAGSIFVGLHYIGQYEASEKTNSPQPLNKQTVVKTRREEFGASNRETSMDGAPIHIIPYDDLGVNE